MICEWCTAPATGTAVIPGEPGSRHQSCGAHGVDWQPFPGKPRPTASAVALDAAYLLEKYDRLDADARQGVGYTMLLEVQARALVSIAQSLATPGE